MKTRLLDSRAPVMIMAKATNFGPILIYDMTYHSRTKQCLIDLTWPLLPNVTFQVEGIQLRHSIWIPLGLDGGLALWHTEEATVQLGVALVTNAFRRHGSWRANSLDFDRAVEGLT